MYGVKKDLDLSNFISKELIQVCLGLFQVQFHFDNGHEISVEGGWDLKDLDGKVIDSAALIAQSKSTRLFGLLSQKVVKSTISSPKSFSLYFVDGSVLTFYDDKEEYETISIQPGDIFI